MSPGTPRGIHRGTTRGRPAYRRAGGTDITRRAAAARPGIGSPSRHALAAALGAIGFLVTGWLLAAAFGAPPPVPGPGSTIPALLALGGGAASGAVLLAGRRVSPAAPLTSGGLWAIGSLLGISDPALLSASILPVVDARVGLTLAATLVLGTLAVAPIRTQPGPQPGALPGPQSYPGAWTADEDTDRDLPAVRPAPRRRPDGPGPRHRAAPGAPRVPTLATRRAPVPDQRRTSHPHRAAAAVRPAGQVTPRRQWG